VDVELNLKRLREEALTGAKTGAEMVVFPELFLTGYTRPLDPQIARDIFAEVSAAAPEVLFVFGSISEARHNRVTVWSEGYQLAFYDKVHLFHPNGEHELWDAGQSYVAFEWRDLRIGLVNCNDIRFPEQARALKLEGQCDVLVVPAWWPWRRDHIWMLYCGLGRRDRVRRCRQSRLRSLRRTGAHRRRSKLRARSRQPAAHNRRSR
jgi:predicted amidohydrolase